VKEWISNLLAIRETRVSTIIVFLILFSGFGMWQFFNTGEINENIKVLILNCLYLIGGVNITSDIVEAIKTKNNNVDNI